MDETFAAYNYKNTTIHSIQAYQQSLNRFLRTKSYRLVNVIDQNYIYRLIERNNNSEITVTTVNTNNQ